MPKVLNHSIYCFRALHVLKLSNFRQLFRRIFIYFPSRYLFAIDNLSCILWAKVELRISDNRCPTHFQERKKNYGTITLFGYLFQSIHPLLKIKMIFSSLLNLHSYRGRSSLPAAYSFDHFT